MSTHAANKEDSIYGTRYWYHSRRLRRQPECKSAVTSTMIMGCAIAETTGLYGLVIGILLIFVAPNLFVNILLKAIG